MAPAVVVGEATEAGQVGPRAATTGLSETATITITAEMMVAGSTAVVVATEVEAAETVAVEEEAETRREEFLMLET